MLKPGKPTLEMLAEIPWGSLSHAYGRAIDVPSQIASLLNPDPKIRREILFGFTCNIYHQGSRYPATVYAIPPLVMLLEYEGVEGREGILDILSILAEPDQENDFLKIASSANPIQELPESSGNQWDPDPHDVLEEQIISRQCYAEVAAGCPVYDALLEHDHPPVVIAACRLLSLFPLHAWNSGEKLLRLACNSQLDEMLRGAALIALANLDGANVASEAKTIADRKIEEHGTDSEPVSFIVAAWIYFQMSVQISAEGSELSKKVSELAKLCVGHGIAAPAVDYYEQRLSADEIESSQDYYEAFLEPITEFPWSLEALIQHRIRSSLRKPKPTPESNGDLEITEDSETDEFELDSIIEQLSETSDEVRAISISRMLINHAFGESYGLTSTEYPVREFEVDEWTADQRKVLESISKCDLLWPQFAMSVQMALDIEFKPTQQELVDALNGVAAVIKEKPEITEPADFSESGVLRAVKKLYESLAIKPTNTRVALDEFAPYRSHAKPGLDFLIDKLGSAKKTERESAAWALGRIGEFAMPVANAMLAHLDSDLENSYLTSAISELPLETEMYESLCDRIEKPENENQFRDIERIIGSNISDDRLLRWIDDPSEELRVRALRTMSTRWPEKDFKPHLLRALEEDDNRFGASAQNLLGCDVADWYFDDFDSLSAKMRHKIAEGLLQGREDFSQHRESYHKALRSTKDEKLLVELVPMVCKFATKTTGDFLGLEKVVEKAQSTILKSVLIETFLRSRVGFEELAMRNFIRFANDGDEFIRAKAIESLGFFQQPEPAISDLLQQALADSSQSVRLKSLWCLSYRSENYSKRLVDLLDEKYSDRITAEVVWSLAGSPHRQIIEQRVAELDQSNRPLTKSAADWLSAKSP